MTYAFTSRKDWMAIDGEPCKVVSFAPLARVEGGKVYGEKTGPRALIEIEAPHLNLKAVGSVGHQLDFMHLWYAFQARDTSEGQEVLIFGVQDKITGVAKLFAPFMPVLAVWVCKAEAYELLTDQNYRRDLGGRDRFLAEAPIAQWEPFFAK